jgi:hypothetical protein
MRPDPGCYEKRYRLTRPALILALVLLVVGLGFLLHTTLIAAALPVLLAIPAVRAVARPRVAFRADHTRITLGSDWQLLPRRPGRC